MDFTLTKEQQLIVVGLIASIVIGLAVMAFRPIFNAASPQPMLVQPKRDQLLRASMLVHVCGAVKREGVYKLKPGDRILDALTLAGGAQPSADLSAVNLAETVKDGVKILIPAKQLPIREVAAADVSTGSTRQKNNNKVSSPAARINLNTADEKALDSLPGVGPATAKAIVEYRRTNGSFAKTEQIMEIPRFGKSKFARIKDMITL
jgi:competence protein ComEA